MENLLTGTGIVLFGASLILLVVFIILRATGKLNFPFTLAKAAFWPLLVAFLFAAFGAGNIYIGLIIPLTALIYYGLCFCVWAGWWIFYFFACPRD